MKPTLTLLVNFFVQCMEFIAGGAYGSGRFSIGLGLGILQRRINSYLATNFAASVA